MLGRKRGRKFRKTEVLGMNEVGSEILRRNAAVLVNKQGRQERGRRGNLPQGLRV